MSPDSLKDYTPCTISSTAPTTAPLLPPPPPPKNAARMLALALAESAQQVSIHSQSQTSGPSTPVSPLQPHDTSDFQDMTHPVVQLSTREEESGGNSPPPTLAPVKSHLTPSSPTIKQQPLDLPSMVSKQPDSVNTSRAAPSIHPETDSTSPDSLLYQSAPVPKSTSQTSPTRKSPQRQQTVTMHIPVHTSSSSDAPATTPVGSSRDTQVLTQSTPEVSRINLLHRVTYK